MPQPKQAGDGCQGSPVRGTRQGAGRRPGAVDTIDFKGQYGLEVKDPEALGALYDRVLAAFPDAYLEDPHDLPEMARRLGDLVERVSYDAPIHGAEDIGATPLPARVVNVKPLSKRSDKRLTMPQ
jgi:hypothetical protein